MTAIDRVAKRRSVRRSQLRLKDGSVREFAVAMRRAEIRDEAHVVTDFWDRTDL